MAILVIPRQICIIPVNQNCYEYSDIIYQLYKDKFNVERDISENTLGKKIRNAQLSQFNFIFVVGEKEQLNNVVSVRNRETSILGSFNPVDLIDQLNILKNTHSNVNSF